MRKKLAERVAQLVVSYRLSVIGKLKKANLGDEEEGPPNRRESNLPADAAGGESAETLRVYEHPVKIKIKAS